MFVMHPRPAALIFDFALLPVAKRTMHGFDACAICIEHRRAASATTSGLLPCPCTRS